MPSMNLRSISVRGRTRDRLSLRAAARDMSVGALVDQILFVDPVIGAYLRDGGPMPVVDDAWRDAVYDPR